MAATRVYLVRTQDGKNRLIKATNVAQARNHAARDTFAVSIPTPEDAHRLAREGIELEEVGREPEPAGDSQ
jgi:hypothetical protein